MGSSTFPAVYDMAVILAAPEERTDATPEIEAIAELTSPAAGVSTR